MDLDGCFCRCERVGWVGWLGRTAGRMVSGCRLGSVSGLFVGWNEVGLSNVEVYGDL